MSVEEEAVLEPAPTPWWRQRWLVLAVVVLAAEVAAVWLLSADAEPVAGRPRRPNPRYRLLTEAEGSVREAEAAAWGLLMSPSVMLVPSEHDFSGSGWLAGPKAEVALEAFVARVQPLPFVPMRGEAARLEAVPRLDPGPASRWEVPRGGGRLPAVGPVALPADGWVRILDGFAGWRLASEPRLEPLPGGLLVPRVVVRVVIDGTGTPASPPVVWESSGEAVSDDAALALVRGLEWVWQGAGGGGGVDADSSWGLVAVSWPAPREAGTGNAGGPP